MNEREQMEALLAGKIVMCDGDRYKLDEDGDLVQCVGGESWCKVGVCKNQRTWSFRKGVLRCSRVCHSVSCRAR